MPDDVVFVLDQSSFNELVHSRSGDVYKHIAEKAEKLRVLAIRQVGKKTGALASSIKVSMVPTPNGPMALVGSDNKIALIHHNGTRPHAIAARPGRQLRFAHRGRIVYAQKVMHPGTRPNRYLEDNLRRVVVD